MSTTTTSTDFVTSRAFDAPREKLWQAFTSSDEMMKWFAPKGVTNRFAKMDLRPGGMYHYCMVTPDGKEMWGKAVYREIVAPEKLVWLNSFSDAQGGITRHPLSPVWPLEMLTTVAFAEKDGKTTLTVTWVPINATPEEQAVFDAAHDGMRQGWGGTFDNLGEYLAKK